MSAIDAWILVGAVTGVLWVWWKLLMFTLQRLEDARARLGDAEEWGAWDEGEAEDSPGLAEGTGR